MKNCPDFQELAFWPVVLLYFLFFEKLSCVFPRKKGRKKNKEPIMPQGSLFSLKNEEKCSNNLNVISDFFPKKRAWETA